MQCRQGIRLGSWYLFAEDRYNSPSASPASCRLGALPPRRWRIWSSCTESAVPKAGRGLCTSPWFPLAPRPCSNPRVNFERMVEELSACGSWWPLVGKGQCLPGTRQSHSHPSKQRYDSCWGTSCLHINVWMPHRSHICPHLAGNIQRKSGTSQRRLHVNPR